MVNEGVEQINFNRTGVFLKLLVLLFADDTVLLSETNKGLQEALDSLKHYCNKWKMVINSNKTTIVIFSKRNK